MRALRAAALVSVAIFAASAHFAWLETEPVLTVGKKTEVKVGFAHSVGPSESAVSLENLQLWAVDPSGAKTALTPVVSGAWVVAEFTPKSAGVHRFVMTQDRGVLSQTAKGYKPGGRDVHPDAKKSLKLWRSASVYASAGGAPVSAGAPLKLPLEVLMDRKADEMWLTVLRNGQPAAGAEVAASYPGKEDTVSVGKTNAAGKLAVKQNSVKGPVAYVVSVEQPVAKGANFDTDSLTSVVHVTW